MEPELGLGVLLGAGAGKLEIYFPAGEVTRTYAMDSAPVRRALVRAGRKLTTHDGAVHVVASHRSDDGVVTYATESGEEISEDELSDTMSFSTPEERLLAGQVDHMREFRLRVESLYRGRQMYQSPVRGLLGARIDLIPHQLGIVSEVASRLAPRVLLADEVGLGKTIEACLIMHRLHVTGRAERVLIVVPDALVHQWFVELLRRFNMLFALFDEERCASIEANADSGNPFLDSQLVLCPLSFLAENTTTPERGAQAVEAGWDMLIVDEAHHLQWSREHAGAGYELVEALAAEAPSVLLLTATPQQLGRDGHFARLRLLEPDRFRDIDAFYAESERYEQVASDLDQLLDGGCPSGDGYPARVRQGLEKLAAGDESVRAQLVDDLLTSFGTGHLMFRNSRRYLTGFPERRLHLSELAETADEWEAKTEWLIDFIRQRPGQKVLVICQTLDLVLMLEELLRDRISLNLATFHEDLTLLQRDRNAAYFAEEDGAQLLLCSEIGSEGRNFQFVQDLVLLDLPEDPGLLEQRIGRLDRIGQSGTVEIHVPVLKDSAQQRLARWYHEGLDAFETCVAGAAEIEAKLGDGWRERLENNLSAVISETKALAAEVAEEMESGHDRLLALASKSRGDVGEIVGKITRWDGDEAFEEWLMRLLDHFGLKVEGLGNRTYLLHPGNVEMASFPALPEEGMCVTLDRERALSREELVFLSADHPIVRSAVEMMLSSEAGNSSFGVWVAAGESGPKSIILECYYVLECLAPPKYQIDRFLAPRPIRVACDHTGKDWTDDKGLLRATLRKGAHQKILGQEQVTKTMIPAMLTQSEALADELRSGIVHKAIDTAKKSYSADVERLKALAELNDLVRSEEVDELEQMAAETEALLDKARVRLDSVRLIFRG